MRPNHCLLIITEDSPESYSPSGERIRHLALASSSKFSQVTVLSLRTTKKATARPKQELSTSLYTINFTRAMPYPLSAFFDPVKMLMFLFHGLVIGRRIKPSHVLASMPPLEAGTSAWLLSKLWHVNLVIDLRDDWESAADTLLKRYFPTLLMAALSSVANKVYSSALAIFTVTKTIEYTIHRRGIRVPLFLIPNGADTKIFRPRTKEAEAKIRIKYDLPLNRVIAVYSGSGLNPYYRLDLVLRAISMLPKDMLEMLFFVFYVYNGHEYLHRFKAQLGISDRCVEIRDPLQRNQLAEVLSSCDIGLVPFDAKPYLSCARSTKIYEYLSCGLCVVGSGPRGGELDSFFSRNPDLGLFTEPSASNFANLLTQVSEKGENLLDEDFRELRHEFIRRNYDRQSMMIKAIDIMSSMLKQKAIQ